MKKFKSFAGIVFFLLIVSVLNGQTAVHTTADVIVLMDTSGTILPYYEAINKRVLQSIVSKFIRPGDFFHLLSFSAEPRYEMSQQIDTEADLSRVVSRFMLLYQLGQSADFLSGINFAGQYMQSLPSSREKILVVISDGIFNPPASSPYRHYTGEQVKTELAKASASIRAQGWKVYYVKLPFPSDAVIKDLDGTFYAGKLDAAGLLDRSGVDSGAGGAAAVSSHTAATDAASRNASSGTERQDSVNQNTQPAGDAASTDNAAVRTDAATATGDTGSANASVGENGAGSGKPKEYTDVSQAFAENLGIEPSPLPEEGSIEFSDTVFPIPRIVFPERIEVSGSSFELPLLIVNEAAEPVKIKLQSLTVAAGGDVQKTPLENTVVGLEAAGEARLTLRVTLPENVRSAGQYRTDIRLDAVQHDKTFSQAAAVLLTVKPTFMQSLLTGTAVWILLGVLLLILLVLLLIFIIRRRNAEPVTYAARVVGQQSDFNRQSELNKERQFAATAAERYYPEPLSNKTDPRDSLNTFSSQTAAAAAATQKETASQIDYLAQEQSRNMEGRFALLNSAEGRMNRRPGFAQYHTGRISKKPSQSGMTELFVYNQTTLIGKRNIHMMKPGARMSIGGGKNDEFFIFLVPFPANLAQIQYDGRDYNLSILKPEYFPYETSHTVYNCIGRDITIVSTKGYHVTFTFRGYEDPMVRLNTILTSINYTAERREEPVKGL